MKRYSFWAVIAAVFGAGLFFAMPAMAEPQDWGIWMQPAASGSAERIQDFYWLLTYIITGIVIFVTVLLLIVMVRFNAKANPNPSKVTHNVLLEVIWTVIPVVILIIIAVPSFKLLYKNDRLATPEMTLKVTGSQWYWSYEYPDQEGIAFSSLMIPNGEIDASKGHKRLLSTDNPVVLPVETNISILVTASDVIHSWAVPQLGIKLDAVPGRTNETWFRIEKPGIYYGQCSEICGKDHAFMPVEIWAVDKDIFARWAALAKDDVESADIRSLTNLANTH